MLRSSLPCVLLVLTTLGWIQDRRRPIVPLGEGTMTIEATLGGETVVRIEAESEEELERVRIRKPGGESFLELETANHRGLSGLTVELRETSLATLLASYAEGEYQIRAATRGGSVAVGSATLSFDLPAAPRVVYPPPDARGVPATGLTVLWLADRSAAGYRLQLEQGETDGLAVTLPPGRGSFRIPDGFLPRGAEVQLELAAIGANGNRTVVESRFTTRP